MVQALQMAVALALFGLPILLPIVLAVSRKPAPALVVAVIAGTLTLFTAWGVWYNSACCGTAGYDGAILFTVPTAIDGVVTLAALISWRRRRKASQAAV